MNRDLKSIVEWSINNALSLNSSKLSLLIIGSLHCYSVFTSSTFLLILFQFLTPSLLRILVSMLILHGHSSHTWPSVSGCLCCIYVFFISFATSFPALQNFPLLNYLLFLYYAVVVYVPVLNQHLLNRVQRIQKSCLRFFYCVRKYDHNLRITRDLAGLRFGNVYFSPVLSCIFSTSLQYSSISATSPLVEF